MKWDGEWYISYEVFRDLGLAFAAVLVLIYILGRLVPVLPDSSDHHDRHLPRRRANRRHECRNHSRPAFLHPWRKDMLFRQSRQDGMPLIVSAEGIASRVGVIYQKLKGHSHKPATAEGRFDSAAGP